MKKLIFLTATFFTAFILNAQHIDTIKVNRTDTNAVFTIVQQMPVFPMT
jgi:hypothetical protein